MRTVSAVLVVAALVIAGCGTDSEEPGATSASSAVSGPATGTTSGMSPNVITTPTRPPTVIDYGPVTLVSGTDTFSADEGTVTRGPGRTLHSRRGSFTSTLTCDDPRVAGTAVSTWSTDRWVTSPGNGPLVQWGRTRITSSGGAWVGRYTGVYTPKSFDHITWWFTGTGGYRGLAMYMWETTSGGFEATFQAMIFPGRPPAP